jgi:hypothetical protein
MSYLVSRYETRILVSSVVSSIIPPQFQPTKFDVLNTCRVQTLSPSTFRTFNIQCSAFGGGGDLPKSSDLPYHGRINDKYGKFMKAGSQGDGPSVGFIPSSNDEQGVMEVLQSGNRGVTGAALLTG